MTCSGWERAAARRRLCAGAMLPPHLSCLPTNPAIPPCPSTAQLILMMTSFEVSVNLTTAMTGLFAMNVMLRPGVLGQGPYWQFVTISVVTGVATIVLFVGILAYCRIKRLI